MEVHDEDTLEKSPLLKSYKNYSYQSSPDDDDPMSLRSKKVSDEQLEYLLKDCKTGNAKQVRAFYKEQNQLIDTLLALHVPNYDALDGNVEPMKVRIAIRGSFIANVILFSLELAATIMSGSLTLLATTLDAFMDILSSAILLMVNWRAKKARGQVWRYPVGAGRFQTVGVIVFGTLMATLSLQIFLNAVQSLVEGSPRRPQLGLLVILFMAVALFSKSALFIYCAWVRRSDPGGQFISVVTVLAQDHRNDILLTSTGLLLSILGDRVNELLDPIGALFIALIILRSWSATVLEQCQLLVGICSDASFHKQILYLAMTHDAAILQIETCRVYHSGTKLFVEVHVVLPPSSTLRFAHDVGESLETKLERLPSVERAFVHVDYETLHHPEHSISK